MLYRTKELKGYVLHSLDGEIGNVKTFYFDDHHWVVRYMVVDTGNWLKERKVLISPYALTAISYEKRFIQVGLTKAQIEGSPSLDTDKPVSLQFEESFYLYYGWPAYWGGEYMWGAYPNLVRGSSDTLMKNLGGKVWDPHLRNTKEVNGYSILAPDGDVGYVEDFLLDEDTWAIRYMIVQTREWWPGKKVLVAPPWIERVSWDESLVYINLTREAIRNAPAYEEADDLTRAYENNLHHHYNRDGYWEKYPVNQPGITV